MIDEIEEPSDEEKLRRKTLIDLAFEGDAGAKKILKRDYGMLGMTRNGITMRTE